MRKWLTALVTLLVAGGAATALALPQQDSHPRFQVKARGVARTPYYVGNVIRIHTHKRVLHAQWLRCGSVGRHCLTIRGATRTAYRIRQADLGHSLRAYVVTAGNQGNIAATSTASPVVLGAIPVNTILPSISGVAQSGQMLQGSVGTWKHVVSYTFQWQDCDSSGLNCVDNPGATTESLLLTGDTGPTGPTGDVGHTIVFVVTAYNYSPAGSTPAGSAK